MYSQEEGGNADEESVSEHYESHYTSISRSRLLPAGISDVQSNLLYSLITYKIAVIIMPRNETMTNEKAFRS